MRSRYATGKKDHLRFIENISFMEPHIPAVDATCAYVITNDEACFINFGQSGKDYFMLPGMSMNDMKNKLKKWDFSVHVESSLKGAYDKGMYYRVKELNRIITRDKIINKLLN